MRPLLQFKGLDGEIEAEVLGRAGEFAELVDLEDCSVLHSGVFFLNGAEWIIESVTASEYFVRVICVPAGAPSQLNGRIPAPQNSRP